MRAGDSTCYRQALTALNRGDYDTALETIELSPASHQSPESLLLCARALIRKDRLSDAREWLARSVSSHRTSDNHATQLMLQGAIESRECNTSGAEALFARALELKIHHRLRAEIHYERALCQFLADRHDDARSTLRAIRSFPDVVSVKAIELEGQLHLAAGNYRSAREAFGTALNELDKCAEIDMSLRASLLCAFAELVSEIEHDQGDQLEREAERVTWTASVVREQVQTLRYIGLMHRRAGRLNDAVRLFGQASSIAPGSPWQILGIAECACLCVEEHDSIGAGGYLIMAQCLANQIEWSCVRGEQRLALLVLAQAFARSKAGNAARVLVDNFCSTAPSQMPTSDAQINDNRLSTFTKHTMGLVAAACGDIGAGRETLSGVHRAWSRIGYRWRALDALNDVKRIDPRRMPDMLMNGASDIHRAILVGEERTLPRAGQQTSSAALRERFARQYDIKSSRLADILQLAARGRSNKEIAHEVGLAERTVKNKVIQLYGIVGVKHRGASSRAELVARCSADAATP